MLERQDCVAVYDPELSVVSRSSRLLHVKKAREARVAAGSLCLKCTWRAFFLAFTSLVLRVEPRALCMLCTHSPQELHRELA